MLDYSNDDHHCTEAIKNENCKTSDFHNNTDIV